MAERVESAATEILRNELGALEEWMGGIGVMQTAKKIRTIAVNNQ